MKPSTKNFNGLGLLLRGSKAALLLFCVVPLYSSAQVLPATAQPILTTLAAPVPVKPATTPSLSISATPAPAPIILRILNDSGLQNYANIILDWELRANGSIRQKGSIGNLPIAPKHPATLRLPVRIPSTSSEELFLALRYRYRAGRPLATASFLLKPWTNAQLPVRPSGELSFTDENGLFTIQSPITLIRFDKQTGWLQAYEVKNTPFITDTPGLKPHFWLEPSDYGYSAGDTAASPTWAAASRAPHLQLFSTSTGSQLVIVRAEYTLPETSGLLHLSYTINAAGEMQVEQLMEADSTQQGESLPCFGMYWLLPPGYDSVTYYGELAAPAIHRITTTPARESSNYNGVRWWKIANKEGKGLQITADSTLLTIGMTAQNRLTIDRPAAPYHLPYGNYRYVFKVSPALTEEKNKSNK